MMKNGEDILNLLQSHREDLRRFGTRRLALFGSAVRGEAERASDLDFLVELDNKTFDAYMGLKIFLEDLFECEVDLVLADAIKPRSKTPASTGAGAASTASPRTGCPSWTATPRRRGISSAPG